GRGGRSFPPPRSTCAWRSSRFGTPWRASAGAEATLRASDGFELSTFRRGARVPSRHVSVPAKGLPDRAQGGSRIERARFRVTGHGTAVRDAAGLAIERSLLAFSVLRGDEHFCRADRRRSGGRLGIAPEPRARARAEEDKRQEQAEEGPGEY